MKTTLLILLVSSSLAGGAAADPASPPAESVNHKALEDGLSPAIVEKLTQQQLVEVLQQREKTRRETAVFTADRHEKYEDILVPFAFFACLFGLVGLPLYFRHRKDREQQATLRLMIEKGVTIPVEFLAQRQNPHSDLRRGVVLVATGVGIGVFFRVLAPHPGVWALGLIPFLIGVGYLVVWKLTAPAPEASPLALP
jgi:hypothetical protein